MCGIAGVLGARVPELELPGILERMADALAHRGPDQRGILPLPEIGAGLASQRLALVDPEKGRQPFASEDGSVRVLLDGEIYNHAALRASLEEKGHRLRSGCDGEVIPHLYEERGLDCLDELDGMFALAILDRRRRRLLLARDGAGMKHLYWTATREGFCFASEVKALLASGLVAAEPDLGAVRTALFVGYTPAPLTGFRGIQKLCAGAWLETDAGGVRQGSFRRLAFQRAPRRRSDDDWAEDLEERLDASVRAHLAADVPVGLLLSGGWDSSLVAHFACRAAAHPLKSFSIVFPDDPTVDESVFARRMAAHLGTQHREVEFRCREIPQLLAPAVRHLEEPNARSATLLRYKLARLAGGEVKAVLSGEGSDELFAGYRWFKGAASWRARMAALLARPGRDPLRAAAAWLHGLGPSVPDWLLAPELRQQAIDLAALAPPEGALASCRDELERRLCLEFTGRLADGLLLNNDKMGMAHALEVRMPFLHRPIVDFASALPGRMKLRGGRGKFVLGRLTRHLPPAIAARRKFGLTYPWGFIEGPEVRPFVRELLLDGSACGSWIDRRSLETCLPSKARWGPMVAPLWCLVVLQTWLDEFFRARAGGAAAGGFRSTWPAGGLAAPGVASATLPGERFVDWCPASGVTRLFLNSLRSHLSLARIAVACGRRGGYDHRDGAPRTGQAGPKHRAGRATRSRRPGEEFELAKKIYVGNLPFNTSEDELRTVFERYGSVASVSVITDRETGRPRGFAFVEMDEESSAADAIRGLDGTELGGRSLRVNEAQDKRAAGGGGGGGGYGRGGGGGGGYGRGGGGRGGGGGGRY